MAIRQTILGVSIDNPALAEVGLLVRQFLRSDDRQHIIATVNPEFIVAAQHDPEFMNILNKADLSVADGFGVTLASWWLHRRRLRRVTGVDLVHEICRVAAEQGSSVFLLGAKPGVAEQASARLVTEHPELAVVGAESGYRGWHRRLSDEQLVELINRRKPVILMVAFGQVKQEKWIYHTLPKLPSVKLAIGVGGTFDYLAGRVRRAPAWMRAIGLEWLFRVVRQPWRLPRIFTAVVRFSWAVLRHTR